MSEILINNVQNRVEQLKKLKKQGIKVVGYYPGNYVPEELIYAAGAIPICFASKGDINLITVSSKIVPDLACPFVRTQIAGQITKTNPFYEVVDFFIIPVTCQHVKKLAEIWNYFSDVEIFKLGVPHQYYDSEGLNYYTERLNDLRNKLEKLTGNEINSEKLKNAINIYNKIRDCFKTISLSRREPYPKIRSKDFLKLNYTSLYSDPQSTIKSLESVVKEIQEKKKAIKDSKFVKPRVLLTGPNLAEGDSEILEILEAADTEVVIEEFFEGIRYYWSNIDDKGDVMNNLAKWYLRDRLPCAFMRYSSKKRLDFALDLISDFNIDGVIWYELLGCETYDMESFLFHTELQKRDIQMIILESSYGLEYSGQLKTRIEAFVEILKGGL